MRLALLDLGTTALRFEVFEVVPKAYLLAPSPEQLERVYRERLMPRLGTDLYSSGRLHAEGKRQTRDFFAKIPQLIASQGVDRLLIGATSALREAEDGPSFVRELEELAQHPVRLLSGEEEAALTARGIRCHETILETEYLLVDIGGGSTELSYFSNGQQQLISSIPLGAIRENHFFLGCTAEDTEAPSCEEIAKLRLHVRGILQTQLTIGAVADIIGSSGTIRSLCKLDIASRRDANYLYKDELHALVSRLCAANFEQRLHVAGLERNRADIIVAGAIIFEEIFAHCHAERVRVSMYSLRHGLLDEAVHALSNT